MKLFKRTLSLFLAFMMVFTSVSLLASADLGDDGISWQISVKYYREAEVATKDADGNYVKDDAGNIVTEKIWIPTNKISRGDSVKARVFMETNYAAASFQNFFFYHQDFLTFDSTLHGSPLEMIFNDKAGSIAAEKEYGGDILEGPDGDSDFLAETLLYEGDGYYPLLDMATFEIYDWIYNRCTSVSDFKTSAITQTGEDWTYEVNFIVKDTADGYGGMFIPEQSIVREFPYDYALTSIAKQPAGDGGHFSTGTVQPPYDTDVNYYTPGPNFDYIYDLGADATDDQIAAAKKAFEAEAETGALSVKTNVKFNLNGGTIDGASTLADAAGYVGDDTIGSVLPATAPKKVIASSDGTTTELEFLGWERVANTYAADDDTTTYYDPYGGIYYVDAETAALAGNENQAGLISDLSAQTFGYKDVTLRAVYQSPAKYQQNVYLENIADEEYALSAGYSGEMDAIGGDIIKSADYVVPEGFVLNAEKSTASITVSADEVKVLNIYLDRKDYTATFKSGLDGSVVETVTGKYEAPLTAPKAAEVTGYSFTSWSPAPPATLKETAEYVAQYAAAGANINITYTYVDKANDNKVVTGTYTKASQTGFSYAIVETVPTDPVANTTYITYDEILKAEHYALDAEALGTNATGTVPAAGVNLAVTYAPVEYTATFTDGTPASVEVPYYNTISTLPEAPAAEAGYQFDGWYNGDEKLVAGETKITGDVTFTAKYTKIPRTITYVYEGAPANYTAPEAKTAYIGDPIELPVLPEDEAYIIGEWVVSGADVATGNVGTSDVTVTSKWTKKTYTVQFYADEAGTVPFGDPVTYEHGEGLVYPATTPDKPGYTFDSWEYDAGEAVKSDLDVHPSFNAIPYKVTVLGFDGIEYEETADWNATYGDEITLADLAVLNTEVENYVFTGWYYNGEKMTADTVITVTAPVTISAEYEGAAAKLIFKAGGAIFANGTDTVEVPLKFDDEITADMYPAIPSYEGHTFNRWDNDLVGQVMSNETETITIVWDKNEYNVKFVNGLTNEEIKTVSGKFGDPVEMPELPTATGYSFAWDNTVVSIPAKNEKGELMVAGGTMTVTAVPTANVHTVTYMNGSDVVTTKDVAFGTAIDSSVTLAEVPAGYNFLGWNLDEKATAAGNLGTMPDSDVTVYAVLQAKGDTKYTVEIYQENLEGGYDMVSSKDYTDGTAGKPAPYVVDTKVEGFNYNEADSIIPEAIEGDGSSVLEIYYDRRIISVQIGDDEPIDVPYGSEVDIPDEAPDPTDPGTEFDKWVDENGNEVSDPYTVPDSADGDPVVITPTYKNRMINVYYSVNGTVIKTIATEYTEPIDSTVRPTLEQTPAGYTFLGWNLDEKALEVGSLGSMPANEVTVYAVLEAHTNIKYTVEIYQENLEGGYDMVSSKDYTDGTAGKPAPYVVDTKVEGFNYNEADSIIPEAIEGDGSSVLEIYYDRRIISVQIGDDEPIDVPYGSEVDIPDEAPDPTDPGTEFDKWVDENGNEVSDPYTVPDSADGDPVVITPTYKNRMINVYYYVNDTLVDTVATEYTKAISDTVKVAADKIPAGYSFGGWNLTKGATEEGDLGNMPATEVNVYAVLKALGGIKYTVEIYQETLTDGQYDKVSAKEYLDGTAGAAAPYEIDKNVEGFDYNETKSEVPAAINGDGTSVLKLYYDRRTVSVQIGNDEPIDVPYGTEIDLPDDPDDNDPGTEFDKWVDESGKEVSDPYTVPDSADGDPVVITPIYKNLSFYVTFVDELHGTTKSGSYEYTTKIPNPGSPSAEGFEFNGWYTKDADGNYVDKYVPGTTTVPNADITYYAKYTGLPVSYIVNVYFQNVDRTGWEDVQSESVDGVAGEKAEYTKTFEGFTLDTKNSVTEDVIKGDSTTVLVIYFLRDDVKIVVDGKEEDVPYGTEIKEEDLNPTVEPGYKVDKWTDADGNEIEFPVTIKGGETFVPVTVKDTFTIKFQLVDGTPVGEEITAEYDSDVTAPQAPDAAEGYTFAGWLDTTTNTYFDGKMPAKDTVYVAYYTNNKEAEYTVNIYIMNTKGVEELSGSYKSTAAIGTTQTVVPGTVEFCTLDTAKSNTSCVVLADGTASINLYFVRGLYTVSFDGVETDVYAGAAIPVPADPAEEGREFLGWTPEVPDVMPENDLAFTSTWKDIDYTITYIVNGDEIVHTYKFGEKVTEYEVAEAPAGLVFDGWSAEIPDTMPSKNITVSAIFKAAAYTVTYLDADGNVYEAYSVAYGAAIPVPAVNPEKDFHEFVEWSEIPSTMPNYNLTITPVFAPIAVRLIAAPGSSTVIDRDRMIIYGLEENLTAKVLDDLFLDYEGDGTMVIKPATEGTSRYGTGAVVELYNNADGSLVESFHIVVFGDINGDSVINGIDVSMAQDEAFWITDWSLEGSSEYNEYMVIAANLDSSNSVIDTNDVGNIKNYVLSLVDIDQTTGKIVRS